VERGVGALTAVIARIDRAIQYAVADVLMTNASGILDHPDDN